MLYLTPLGKTVSGYKAIIGPAKKRENLQQILSINEEELPSSRWLDDDEVLMGLTRNWRFNSNLYESHLSLIKTLMKWKELAPDDRDAFAKAPWRFAKWCDQLHMNINSALRNTLLYLLFPDSFEDIMVQDDKDSIIKRHYDKMTKQSISDFLSNGRFSNKVQVDKAIFEIRGKLSSESGRRLHLYRDVVDKGSELPGNLPVPSCEQVLEAMGNVGQTDNRSEEADDPSDTACGGQVRLSIHYTRERNQNLRKKKFKEFKKIQGEDGVLYCECCNTTVAAYPGSLREQVFETHHIIPISQYDGQKITNLGDLAVLCANCHRAIHTFPKDQMPRVNEFCQQLQQKTG